MRIFLILLLLSIILTGCTNNTPSTRSIQCKVDSDCKSVTGCIHGCFSKSHLIIQPHGEACGTLGPRECSCIENVCADTGTPIDICGENICLSGMGYSTNDDNRAIIVFTFTNNNTNTQTFEYNLIQEYHDNNISITIPYNSVKLDPNETDKKIIIINSNSKGQYIMKLIVTGENNVNYSKEFFLTTP